MNMNMNKLAILMIVFLAGCQSTNPRIDYINKNEQAVTNYQEKHGEKLAVLSNLIIKKCFFDVVDKKNDLSMADLLKMTPKGIVTLELEPNGNVINPLYEVNVKGSYLGKNLKSCIEATALNYSLPPSNGLTYLYLTFNVEMK
jgi:hypothetical protein